MEYTCKIIINKPLKTVVSLFDNPENMLQWMEGLESFEHLSGVPSQPGSKSRLNFKMGKRKMQMIETITQRDLPNSMSGTYQMNGNENKITTRFKALSDSQTEYTTIQEFKFKSLGMKFFAFLFPSLFKKQTMKYLESFKKFVESQP